MLHLSQKANVIIFIRSQSLLLLLFRFHRRKCKIEILLFSFLAFFLRIRQILFPLYFKFYYCFSRFNIIRAAQASLRFSYFFVALFVHLLMFLQVTSINFLAYLMFCLWCALFYNTVFNIFVFQSQNIYVLADISIHLWHIRFFQAFCTNKKVLKNSNNKCKSSITFPFRLFYMQIS